VLGAKKAMKPISAGSTIQPGSVPPSASPATVRLAAIPAEPTISSVLRPSRSISSMPTAVKTPLTIPMMIACTSAESAPPAAAKMSLR
jgi:hypothetical protein